MHSFNRENLVRRMTERVNVTDRKVKDWEEDPIIENVSCGASCGRASETMTNHIELVFFDEQETGQKTRVCFQGAETRILEEH